MKKTIAILAVLLAAQAQAETAWVNVGLRKVNKFQHPQVVIVEGRTVSLPAVLTDSALAYLAAAGWVAYEYDCAAADTILDYDAVPPFRCMTAQELADRESARAAEQAAAEAQAALPTVFETGIAVLDADGHHMEFVPVADGEPPLAIQISDSPLDKATRDAKVAAKLAEFAAAKAERKALKDRELDDLKAAIASAKNHKELGAAVVKWIEATEPATVEDSK